MTTQPLAKITIEDADSPPLLIVACIMVALFLVNLDQTIMSSVAPVIARKFGNLSVVTWLTTAYVAASAASFPIAGYLCDRIGCRVGMLAALAIFIAGSIIGAFAASMDFLIAARAIQGVGAGLLACSTSALVGVSIRKEMRARYQGLFAASVALATVLGPLAGSMIFAASGLTGIFAVVVPPSLLCLLVIYASHDRGSTKGIGSDWKAVFGPSLLIMLTVLALSPSDAGVETLRLASGGGAAVVLAMLVLRYASIDRSSTPMLAQRRTYVIAFATNLLGGFILMGSLTYLPAYLQIVRCFDPIAAAISLTPMVLGLFAGTLIVAFVRYASFSYAALPRLGSVLIALGVGGLAVIGVRTTTGWIMLAVALVGFGLGLSSQIVMVVAQSAVPREMVARATAGMILARSIGGVAGVPGFGLLLSREFPPLCADGTVLNKLGLTSLTMALGPVTLAAETQSATYAHAFSFAFTGAALIVVLICILPIPYTKPSRVCRP